MRGLVGLLCLGMLASGVSADAKPKPRPAPVRGARDVGEACETHNQCAAGLACLEAKCRTLAWVEGAVILVETGGLVSRGGGAPLAQYFMRTAAGLGQPGTTLFDVHVALEKGAVPVETILSAIRGAAPHESDRYRKATALIMAKNFPPLRVAQAYEMLFGPGTDTPPPVPELPPAPPSDTPGVRPPPGAPPWHTRPADVQKSAAAPPSSDPDLPSWPSDTPTAAIPARRPSAPPVAGKAAAGPLDDVDRMADLAELVPERPGPQAPAPRVYAGIGEYVGAVGADGLPEGEGRMVYLGGGSYAGSWHAGQWHGAGTLVRPDGQIVRGTFERGRLVKGETFTGRRRD